MKETIKRELFIQIMETIENLQQTFEKAGGSFYKANMLGDITLLEFLETCARNSIRFYWAKDPKLNKPVEDNYKEDKVFIMRYCGHTISSTRTCCKMMKRAIDSRTIFVSIHEEVPVLCNRAKTPSANWSAEINFCPWCGRKIKFVHV